MSRLLLGLGAPGRKRRAGGGGGGGGFPVFESSTSNDSDSIPATSHNVTLPGSLVSGDLLVIALRENNIGNNTGISGWTQVADRDTYNTASVWFKVSDGTETTATITTNLSARVAWIAMRFSNAQSVEGIFAASDTLSPPEHTASYGSAETLWMTFISDSKSNFTFTAPSGYTGEVEAGNASSPFDSRFRVAVAFREVEAAAEQPGPWTHSTTSTRPYAATFAIRS